MENLKTPKDVLMEVVNSACEVTRKDFEDYNMSIEEIQVKLEMLQSIKRFTSNFFELRFSNELKHYNNDSGKAFDVFICNKNLELFRFYIEEVLLLINNPSEKFFDERKMFRDVHNYLCTTFRTKVKDLFQ